MVRTLNVVMDDIDYEKLEKAKGDRNWRDFIMLLINLPKIKKSGEVSK